MGDIVAWVSVAIAAASLWVAGSAYRRTSQQQQRLVEIEERREQDRQSHTRQAALSATLRRADRGEHWLDIVNAGQAEAREVRVYLDDTPLPEHPTARSNDAVSTLFGPGCKISFQLVFTSTAHRPSNVSITWQDDSGTERSWRSAL